MVRDPAEWAAIIKANPLPKKAKERPRPPRLPAFARPRRTPRPSTPGSRTSAKKYDKGEQLKVIGREIYIDYGPSIGESKLILPKKLVTGTARNWNTVLKLRCDAERLTKKKPPQNWKGAATSRKKKHTPHPPSKRYRLYLAKVRAEGLGHMILETIEVGGCRSCVIGCPKT